MSLFIARDRALPSTWRSYKTVEFTTLTWVDWFNNYRLLEFIGDIPPDEAEARLYAMLDERKRSA